MNQLIFKEEWDCITREGRRDYTKELTKYRDNIKKFYKKATEQEKEYLEFNKDYILEHRKRFDKALLFDFHDNDFSEYIVEMMVGQFIPNINSALTSIDPYVTDKSIEAALDSEFDRDTLLVKMKYWFISQYMCYEVINRKGIKEYNPEALDEAYKDAKKFADYLFSDADLFTGTNEEINQRIKQRYGEGQNTSDNIDKYWANGEVFILRIVDNKVTYTII